jgi:hypothetical protein
MRIIFQCILLSAPVASGFIGNMFQPPVAVVRPDLLKITDRQEDKKLNLQLHIGQEQGGPQMTVTKMVIELHHEPADYEHASLPGADGPQKQLSCGHRRLEVLSEGSFINLEGTQKVQTDKGCWEMCWRKGKPAGTLICGFELPQDYIRNEASLPMGTIFLSFPLFTEEGLKIGQEEKGKIEHQLDRFLHERDEALEAYDMTNNPVMKALHLRNAFVALEKHSDADHITIESIPDDDEVMHLQDDLLLTTKGLIWSKDGDFHSGENTILGLATISTD